MAPRRTIGNSAWLFAAAALGYAANCALGTAVAVKLVDTSGFRWLHHALYIATCALSASAIVVSWSSEPRRGNRRAGLALAPAALPLTTIAALGARGRQHPLIALMAAPFFAAGLACSLRSADRK
jgi:hypothetical protein